MNNEERKHRLQKYEIVVEGVIDARWAEWLGGLDVETGRDGTTRFSGLVLDQSALHGILTRLRDLGVPLLLVRRLSDTENDGKDTGENQ